MHKSGENRTTLHRLHLLICYTCMLIVYADDVMLYLYANGMWKLRLSYFCKRLVYMCRLRLEIMIYSMRYVCYNFFLLKPSSWDWKLYLYLYAIVSQIFSCCKSGFFRLKLTFELIQSDPNESSPNRKTAPHQTELHRAKTDLNRCRCRCV